MFWLMDWCAESDGAARGDDHQQPVPDKTGFANVLIDWCSDWWIDVQNPMVQPGEMITSNLFRTKLDEMVRSSHFFKS